jgi:hypothetical protein
MSYRSRVHLIPLRANNLMPRLDVTSKVVLLAETTEVGGNLSGAGIYRRPGPAMFEAIGVTVRRDVTGATATSEER